MTAWLDIVGVGEGEWPPATLALISSAEVVLGPKRLLSRLPPIPNPPGGGEQSPPATPKPTVLSPLPSPLWGGIEGGGRSQHRIEWQSPLEQMLTQVQALRSQKTVILATGDPLWFGIGATLAKHFDADEFRVHPHPSAFQLAAARLHWPLQNVSTVSVHGRPAELILPHLLPGNRLLLLTSDRTTAPVVAGLLRAHGYGQSLLTVLENLGASDERICSTEAQNFDLAIGDFYVLAVDCVADPAAPLLPPIQGLPDDAFVSDGQLTKREVRATTLAKLAPYPGALLWDVGAGCGSVAIEWMRAARDVRAIAFERHPERLAMIETNARALGVPSLKIAAGEAPASLADAPAPDAIFLGGAVADETLFQSCWDALRSGGRFVSNAVTLDGETALYDRQQRLGGELCRIEISVLDIIGAERVLRPRMAVTQWWVQKP